VRRPEDMYHGTLRCSRCGKTGVYSINQYEDHRIEAVCFNCVQLADKAGDPIRQSAAAWPCGIHAEWRLVEKARIHKLSNDHDRRGTIVSLTLRDTHTFESVAEEAVKIAQFLMFFGSQCGIHKLGEEGEQNHVWINISSFASQRPVVVEIRHKYIGEDEIQSIIDSVRNLAKRWGWELDDDNISPLDKLAAI
jgi:DNA-binding MarR family transcriptional regulator